MTAPTPDALAPVRTLAQLYAGAEARLFTELARIARTDVVPAESVRRLDALRRMRQAAASVIAELETGTGPAVDAVMAAAREGGAAAALKALKDTGAFDPELLAAVQRSVGGIGTLDAIAAQLTDTLRAPGVSAAVLRTADDVYRAAVAYSVPLQLTGVTTGRTAEALAWERLIGRGVPAYVDTAGRRWNLATYTEMATRTASGRAWNTVHKDRMNAAGITYYRVSRDGRPCKLCAPFDGQVLSDGPTGRVSAEHATVDGRMVSFTVTDTVAGAQAAGFQHPNCRHTLGPFLPGISSVSAPPTTPRDERREAEQERLRYLERQIRTRKRLEATALDPDRAALHRAKIRTLQAQIRDHVSQTGLNRRRYREQPNLGHR